jgi:hypothetical protein
VQQPRPTQVQQQPRPIQVQQQPRPIQVQQQPRPTQVQQPRPTKVQEQQPTQQLKKEKIKIPTSKVCSYLENYSEKGRTFYLTKKCKDKDKKLTKMIFKGKDGKDQKKECCLKEGENPVLSGNGKKYFTNDGNISKKSLSLSVNSKNRISK